MLTALKLAWLEDYCELLPRISSLTALSSWSIDFHDHWLLSPDTSAWGKPVSRCTTVTWRWPFVPKYCVGALGSTNDIDLGCLSCTLAGAPQTLVLSDQLSLVLTRVCVLLTKVLQTLTTFSGIVTMFLLRTSQTRPLTGVDINSTGLNACGCDLVWLLTLFNVSSSLRL